MVPLAQMLPSLCSLMYFFFLIFGIFLAGIAKYYSKIIGNPRMWKAGLLPGGL